MGDMKKAIDALGKQGVSDGKFLISFTERFMKITEDACNKFWIDSELPIMGSYTFKAAFGNEDKTVRLFQPSGSASKNFYLMMDNLVCGQINMMSDGWHVFFNDHNSFTSTDADVLIEIVLSSLRD